MRREITPEVVTFDEAGCGGPVDWIDMMHWTHLIKSDGLDNLDTFDRILTFSYILSS